MSVEFTCCECGRDIVLIAAEVPPTPPLCAMCQFLPLWFQHPELRALLDPRHDGVDRSAPGGACWPEVLP